MMFDNQKMQPLFQLELSQAGSSFAFEIARKIGLPESVLQSASAKVGKEQVDFDKHLREVLRDKKYWNEKRYKIRQEEKQIDQLVDELSESAENIKSIKKKTISEAKKEAKEILENVNKQVEKTIRDIRESQAEKEKTKIIRKEFEDFKQEIISQKEKEEEDKILQKIAQLKRKKEQKEKRQEQKDNSNNSTKYIKKNSQKLNTVQIKLEKGAKVKIKHTETYGEVLEISEKKVKIAIGSMQMSVSVDKLELVGNKEYKKKTPQVKKGSTILFTDSNEKKLMFSAHIDLRGARVDEAIQKLTRFIDDAITTNSTELKILHGTGTGALKMAVREYLQTVDLVASFKDEQLELGGAGVTVVKMG
jgi:DNA mismatch repair protein MutS2